MPDRALRTLESGKRVSVKEKLESFQIEVPNPTNRPVDATDDISAAASGHHPAKRQAIEEPLTGGRPIVNMILLIQGQEYLVRALLDGGSINKIITIYTQLAFEIGNLSDVDIILPHWCMQQHQP
ncbi:hypothetical protein E4U14_006052, partial [Claviceps sp. LM454 group G7]